MSESLNSAKWRLYRRHKEKVEALLEKLKSAGYRFSDLTVEENLTTEDGRAVLKTDIRYNNEYLSQGRIGVHTMVNTEEQREQNASAAAIGYTDTTMTDLNEWLRETHEMMDEEARLTALRDPVQCADGLRLSIQASRTHYCRPRNNHGPYSAVEVGYPSQRIEQLMPYAEDEDNPTKTVYGWVPVDLLERIIDKHGGMVFEA